MAEVLVRGIGKKFGALQVLHGIDCAIGDGEFIVILGPSGCGKSTLLRTFNRLYELYPGQRASGEILLDGENILEMEPDERAAKGVFLAFQYPLEIPGVATMTFLRTAVNAQSKARGEGELSTPEFMKLVRETAGMYGGSIALDPSSRIAQFAGRSGPSGCDQHRGDIGERCQHEESFGCRWMRNDERPMRIGPFGLRAVGSRMNDCDLLHCDDVDVEAARVGGLLVRVVVGVGHAHAGTDRAGDLAQVEFLLHQIQHEPGEMVLANKISHPHRQQKRLIDLPGAKCLAHSKDRI